MSQVFCRRITLRFFFARDKFADELYDLLDPKGSFDTLFDFDDDGLSLPQQNIPQNNTSGCANNFGTRELTLNIAHSKTLLQAATLPQ